jgi:hypothetical protein
VGGGDASAAMSIDSRGIDVRFLMNRGECLRCLGDLMGARDDFTAALEADPSHWDTRTRLSVVRYEGLAALLWTSSCVQATSCVFLRVFLFF